MDAEEGTGYFLVCKESDGMILRFLIAYGLSLLHESAHFFTAKSLHIETSGFSFWIFGTALNISPIRDVRKEFWISAAGPLFHMALIPFFWNIPILLEANAAMLLVNILPLMPLDGGRMLKSVLLKRIPFLRVYRYLETFTAGSVLLLALVCVWEMIVFKKPIFALMPVVFLILSAHRTKDENKISAMRNLLNRSGNDLWNGRLYIVNGNLKAIRIASCLYWDRESLFLVEDAGMLLGFLSEHQILSALGEIDSRIQIRKILLSGS